MQPALNAKAKVPARPDSFPNALCPVSVCFDFMNGTTLLCALIGHLVGDYLLQNDWMALSKKSFYGSLHCCVHCLLWTASVMLFAGWFSLTEKSLAIWVVLFFTHYFQDRTNIIEWWMDAIGQKQFRTGPCAPWSMIVVDNVWHIVTIWAVWRWIA